MAIPKVSITLVEGALGIPPEQTDSKVIVFGYSSIGVTNQLYDFDQASPSSAKAILGVGRLPQLVASLLATPNHGPVIAVPIASSVGANTAVTESGTTPPDITLTGTPHDDFYGRVEILTGGSLGTATFRYSLDYNAAKPSQATWSQEITTAATYLMPDTGVTLNFAAGTYNIDNRYTWTSTAPTHSNTNVTDGIDAVIANGVDFGWGYVSAAMAGATDADRVTALASLFSAVGVRVDSLEAAYKFVGFTLEAPSPVDPTTAGGLTTWRGALVSGMAASSHKRLMVAAGYSRKAADMTIAGYSLPRRPAGWSVLERISRSTISEHLGDVSSTAGILRGIVSIEHDEETTGGLDGSRFTTLRTLAGRQGFYVTRGHQFATTGSDYSATPRLRVINTASKVLRNAALSYLNSKVVVDTATGRIREDEALAIDADLTFSLNAALVQPTHASSAAAKVSRTNDILATGTLSVEGAVQPVGYAETIPISLGFTRSTTSAS
jgi:hypothetical protein